LLLVLLAGRPPQGLQREALTMLSLLSVGRSVRSGDDVALSQQQQQQKKSFNVQLKGLQVCSSNIQPTIIIHNLCFHFHAFSHFF